MKKLLVMLFLILGSGLLFAYAEDVSKYEPTDKPKEELPVTAVSVSESGGGSSESEADASSYKPKAATVATADVSGRRVTDSAVVTTSAEEK